MTQINFNIFELFHLTWRVEQWNFTTYAYLLINNSKWRATISTFFHPLSRETGCRRNVSRSENTLESNWALRHSNSPRKINKEYFHIPYSTSRKVPVNIVPEWATFFFLIKFSSPPRNTWNLNFKWPQHEWTKKTFCLEKLFWFPLFSHIVQVNRRDEGYVQQFHNIFPKSHCFCAPNTLLSISFTMRSMGSDLFRFSFPTLLALCAVSAESGGMRWIFHVCFVWRYHICSMFVSRR